MIADFIGNCIEADKIKYAHGEQQDGFIKYKPIIIIHVGTKDIILL